MNSVKNIFSIKDFENLSGIKAHTIRIWEKRYNILEPMRTDTNIRCYDMKNLQKLLNIVVLHNYGYKISKIALLSPEEIPLKVKEIISEKSAKIHAIKSFKLAMMNFDHTMFFNTYNDLLKDKTFREVFNDVFIPLMEELGYLWQTDTISPAHEHFITYLIKQKLLSLTEQIQSRAATKTDRVYVLYLPLNEIHELGLMYLNYEFLENGYHTIYLGESVPLESLVDIKNYFDKITFVSYLTVEPTVENLPAYIQKIEDDLLKDTNHEFMLLGRLTFEINKSKISEKIKIYNSITDCLTTL
ncbi:MerR family transcriptional regulator [Flavobacterium sp.]|uniref:MerR family transcriptional regulator n=1 Tax=Flavobacterium sp. TaxID=239 RepID=UPI003F6976EE